MDDFNIRANCDCCFEDKDNCTEHIIDDNEGIKIQLICKECWDYINR